MFLAILLVLPVSFSSSTFFSFLAIIQLKQCLCLFFPIFLFCCHNPGPICVFHIFNGFHCFLSYSRSYHVCISFSSFFSFLVIIQVLQCAFHIIHVFHCFSAYSRSYSVSFSFCTYFSFLAIIQVKQFLCLIFHVFHFFSPYSMPYSVCVSSFSFFSFLATFHVEECLCFIFHFLHFSHHIPRPTVCLSHFPHFAFF